MLENWAAGLSREVELVEDVDEELPVGEENEERVRTWYGLETNS
jgi:hypothetical protein